MTQAERIDRLFRQAKRSVEERLIRERRILLLEHKAFYFYQQLMRLELIRDDNCKTMATNGKAIYYAEPWCSEQTDAHLLGLLIHELLHCEYHHFSRRGNRNLNNWNVACDHVVNADVIAFGFALHPALIQPEARFSGFSAEEVFDVLFPMVPPSERKPDAENDSDSDPSQGSEGEPEGNDTGNEPDPSSDDPSDKEGNAAESEDDSGEPQSGSEAGSEDDAGNQPGNQPSPQAGHELPACAVPGGVFDASPDKAECEELARDWQIASQQAAAIQKARDTGSQAGKAAMAISQTLKPRENWRERLRQFINDRNATADDWTRPNKRFMGQGWYLPGQVADGINHLVIYIDTSGSMDERSLQAAFGEFAELQSSAAIAKITVRYIDTEIHLTETFEHGEPIKANPCGFGGTNFASAFDDLPDDASAIVFYTDGKTRAWPIEPTVPTLWLLWGTSLDVSRINPPFGDSVHMNAADY